LALLDWVFAFYGLAFLKSRAFDNQIVRLHYFAPWFNTFSSLLEQITDTGK